MSVAFTAPPARCIAGRTQNAPQSSKIEAPLATPQPRCTLPKRVNPLQISSARLSTKAPRASKLLVQAARSSESMPLPKQKKICIITGASSGLGLNATVALAKTGEWHIVMACRDYLKAEKAAQSMGIPKDAYTIMHLDLSCLDSVRQFVNAFQATGWPVDVVVANAAVYLPTAKEPTYTAEGFELSVGTNHLGHFLLCNLLLDDLKSRVGKPGVSPRMIIVGSVTGNTNTLAGNIPPKADLGDLSGLAGALNGAGAASMIDGGEFDGAKAYKDSKVCNMLTMRQMHKRFHENTGVTFASLYPGCIATTGLFRNHVGLFRTLFPPFQKYITKGFVSEEEAGQRLAQVVSDPKMSQSGVYWSWNNTTDSFVNEVSEEVSDDAKGALLWDISEKLVGLKPAKVTVNV